MTQPFTRAATSCQTLAPALLRIGIGWHFLYEGLTKLLNPQWTSAGYLQSTTSATAGFYHWLASDPAIVEMVDVLNVWGLILIGACLMVGLFTRLSAASGIVLLALYYAAYPPLFGEQPPATAEGHYLLVNKNLVELFALGVVNALPARALGLDGIVCGLLRRRTGQREDQAIAVSKANLRNQAATDRLSRRQVLAGLTGIPFVGGFALAALERHGWESHEEKQLSEKLQTAGQPQVDAITRPSKTFDWARLDDLKGKLPTAKIGDLQLSRMILGGNLIGGWAHARDLIYVSKLVKAYHHRDKVFETFRLAEACGINTILTSPLLCDVINDYWDNGGGKIQFISDCGGDNVLEMVRKSIDNGACACYIQGGIGDELVAQGKFDLIAETLELIRSNGLPAGIGGHKLATVKACVEKGFEPDFWMKTLHHTNYWSAQPEQQKDNIWCEEPEQTVAFMEGLEQPWIAFKVLAAGAIHPRVGFKYAFESGADFICVGMYDFQIVDDANLALDVLGGKLRRRRQWFA